MRTYLKYDHEEKEDAIKAMNVLKYVASLEEIEAYCRGQIKYNDNLCNETKEALQYVRNLIYRDEE